MKIAQTPATNGFSAPLLGKVAFVTGAGSGIGRAGAVAMTRQMAVDYAKFNIRFYTLCPGFVDTPFNAGFEAQMGGRGALEACISTHIPMGRWATTDEISDAIVFLASELSSFMTGQSLVVDGGESI